MFLSKRTTPLGVIVKTEETQDFQSDGRWCIPCLAEELLISIARILSKQTKSLSGIAQSLGTCSGAGFGILHHGICLESGTPCSTAGFGGFQHDSLKATPRVSVPRFRVFKIY